MAPDDKIPVLAHTLHLRWFNMTGYLYLWQVNGLTGKSSYYRLSRISDWGHFGSSLEIYYLGGSKVVYSDMLEGELEYVGRPFSVAPGHLKPLSNLSNTGRRGITQ